MANENTASSGGQLFAHKGTARPASGLRTIYPEVEHDEDPQLPAAPAKSHETMQRASADGELAEAASLQAGGFKPAALDEPAPPTPDAAGPETGETSPENPMSSTAVAGPAQIETALAEATTPSTDVLATRTTALFARSGTMHPLVVGAAFAALLLVSLGIGYGISIIASSGSAEQGVITPADAIRSAAQRPLPIAGPVPGLASQPETVANIRDKKQPTLTTEVATAPKLVDDRKTAASAGKAGETEASAAPVTDHAYTVQIGSLPNRESAELLWRRVTGAHAGLFADTGMNVRRVRVENRVHYRVQIGAFGNIAGAQGFCQKIQSRGIDCLVTKK